VFHFAGTSRGSKVADVTMKQARVLIAGRVQGVFFRGSAADQAKKYGLFGFARNLSDGRVELVLEGGETQINEMIRWCRKGPPLSHVADIEIEWSEAQRLYQGFDVK
jgi:acylphosphatase